MCILFIDQSELPETDQECNEVHPVSTGNAQHVVPAANYFLLQPPMRQNHIRIDGENSFPSIEEV